MLPQPSGPAGSTRQRTALGDISNRGYSQLKDGKAGAGKASGLTASDAWSVWDLSAQREDCLP